MSNTFGTYRFSLLIWFLSSAILYYLVGYSIPRTNMFPLLISWTFLFAGYAYIYKYTISKKNITFLIVVAILLRLLFLVSTPALSDDYFRFLWDGAIWNDSINPFAYTPSNIIRNHTGNSYYFHLYQNMNSPDYYSVYPSVMQYIFIVGAAIFKKNILAQIIFMRVIIIAAEVGTILVGRKLLIKLGLPEKNILLYALNPLIIIELTGNLHFEGVMIFFITSFLYLFYNKKYLLSAIPFTLAVCTKLIPLIFLPLILFSLNFKKSLSFLAIVIALSIVLFIPFLSGELIQHIYDSVELYFQHFEFNASIYYIFRAIGYEIKGYNIIDTAGIILAFTFIITYIFIIVRYRKSISTHLGLIKQLLHILFIYYLLALIVHPWYVSTLVLLCVFTAFRYPIVWSFLIGFTYVTYATVPYKENLWIVAMEYVLLILVMVYEFYYNKNRLSPKNVHTLAAQ